MAPFGWAAKPLAVMLEADPSLYWALFTLSRRRMHLIALALGRIGPVESTRHSRGLWSAAHSLENRRWSAAFCLSVTII